MQTFPAYAGSCVCNEGRIALKERRMLLSNKKLTTEEKIVKSQLYSEEIESLKKRLAEKKAE